jgi:hypothetical protein
MKKNRIPVYRNLMGYNPEPDTEEVSRLKKKSDLEEKLKEIDSSSTGFDSGDDVSQLKWRLNTCYFHLDRGDRPSAENIMKEVLGYLKNIGKSEQDKEEYQNLYNLTADLIEYGFPNFEKKLSSVPEPVYKTA